MPSQFNKWWQAYKSRLAPPAEKRRLNKVAATLRRHTVSRCNTQMTGQTSRYAFSGSLLSPACAGLKGGATFK
jgi:hypothetical protein